jgi:hypothetical protein
MTPSEAATCANGDMTPIDVERIRRADPSRSLDQVEPDAVDPDVGIDV